TLRLNDCLLQGRQSLGRRHAGRSQWPARTAQLQNLSRIPGSPIATAYFTPEPPPELQFATDSIMREKQLLIDFLLLMSRGKDVRFRPLEDRRSQLLEIVKELPDSIRYSETFIAPLSDIVAEVRNHRLEGIVAKRAGSPYRSGEHGFADEVLLA